MKILLVGATGTLGASVYAVLRERGHTVVTASRSGSQLAVDIANPHAISAMYAQAGRLDAVACAAGSVPWKRFTALVYQDALDGVTGKVLSQFELVRQGTAHLTEAGSFTLITGVTARDAVPTGSIASLTNGAIESFVRAAAMELPQRQRINAVSPTVFTESIDRYGATFAGFVPVPVQEAAQAYVRSIEGGQTGQIYVVG